MLSVLVNPICTDNIYPWPFELLPLLSYSEKFYNVQSCMTFVYVFGLSSLEYACLYDNSMFKTFFVCFLATPCNLWNLSSLTRNWTQAFSSESTWSPNHCTTWKSPKFKFLRNFQTRFSKVLYHLILPLTVYKSSNFPTSVSNFLLAFAIICHILLLLPFSWGQIESLWVWLAFP